MKINSIFQLFAVLLFFCITVSPVAAQCPGTAPLPAYDIDLTALPNGVASGSYRLGGECCDQAGQNSCLYFDITVGTMFTGIAMCFDPPCSIEGFWGGTPTNLTDQDWACPTGSFQLNPPLDINPQPIDLCHSTLCIPPGFTTFRVLVCKPGVANNPLEVDIIGVPALNLALNDVSVGCSTQFFTNGAAYAVCGNGSSPPYLQDLPVSWTSSPANAISYLSCTNCTNPVFNYTGPAVPCSGQTFTYNVTLPATPCQPAQTITRTMKVYPAIDGDVLVNRACNDPVDVPRMTFVPDPACTDFSYKWFLSTAPGTVLGEVAVFDPPNPPYSAGETYCVEVTRTTTMLCTPLVICKEAWCCDAQTGENCW